MPRVASRKLLLRAARLLSGQARLTREGCQIIQPGRPPLDWACQGCDTAKCVTRKAYAELVRIAKALREAA
jgi:hypothetical protein